MKASDLLTDAIPPLKTSDSVQKVFDRMNEFRVSHLPIVNNLQFLGLISDEDLVEAPDYDAAIGSLSLSLNSVAINREQHVYEVIRLFSERRITVVPVVDEERNYLGIISINSIVEYIATLTSVREPGGIIVLEVSNRENSLAHMAQIVESSNAQILSSYIRSFPDSTKLEITLKVNHLDLSAIVSSFRRYDYTVVDTFSDLKSQGENNDRYDQLMNYLSF